MFSLLFNLFFLAMNRTCIFVLMTILLSFNSISQIVSGKIIYKIQPIDIELDSKSDKINSLNEKMYQEAQKQSFTLEFNTIKSSFVLNNILEPNNEEKYSKGISNLASMLITSGYNYYLNLNTKTVILQNTDGLLIEEKYDKKNWEITSESKKIADYLCYKAIYIKNYTGRNGKSISIPITAWFAPSLPYGYGPKDYNGLPGLILELQERKTIYYASLITLSKDKEIEIEFPKGKTVAKEEYDKKMKAQMGI